MILHIVAGNQPDPPSVPYTHPSLETEGFIHCCFDHQADKVIKLFFPESGEIWGFEIDPKKLKSELKIEPSGLGEDYPHIYGPINIEAFGKLVRLR